MRHNNSCRQTVVLALVVVVCVVIVLSYLSVRDRPVLAQHDISSIFISISDQRPRDVEARRQRDYAHAMAEDTRLDHDSAHQPTDATQPEQDSAHQPDTRHSTQEHTPRTETSTNKINLSVSTTLTSGSTTLTSVATTFTSVASTSSQNQSSTPPNSPPPPGKKYLIYLCDKSEYCYGLGDRQRGVVGVYALAEVTNRQFGISMTSPWPFQDFYEPNEVGWLIPEEELRNKSTTTIRYFQSSATELKEINFNAVYPQDVVYIKTNHELWRQLKLNPYYKHRLPGWLSSRRCHIFSKAWLKLTQPTHELRAKLNELLINISQSMIDDPLLSGNKSCVNCSNTDTKPATNGPQLKLAPSLRPGISKDGIGQLKGYGVADLNLVCAHIRIGHSSTLPFEKERRNSLNSVQAVWNFLRPYLESGHHVYLATDSDEVRKEAKTMFGSRLHNLDAPLVHIAHVVQGQDEREGLKTALVEQLLLMTSCKVLLVSKSGFSMSAAYVRMALIGWSNNYMFKDGGVHEWGLW
ncbi:uncharacterized protein LOC131958580 [Physella acuta]|uniref:uncharacterized protein LOC131958580 n=1 Tax=Physella acuta TaxID=109671 RepID=UPI0027DCD24B|nr:uncharacterized protein LOC131958580 [Physella acuta]